jgi:cytochrome d ubiquinol oxidase subunit I
LLFATVFSLAQLWSGDSNAKMVARNQPAKLAAIEGHFKTGQGDLSLIGWPDENAGATKFNIAIPGLLSFLVHGDVHAPVIGLDKVPRDYWPPVLVSFLAYHAMVGIGTFLIALTLLASYFRWRGTLFEKRWLLWVFVFAVVLAAAANELGWMCAEVGRQPWVVHPRVERDAQGNFALDSNGLLKYHLEEGLLTSRAVSEAVDSSQVISSIVMLGVIYGLLLIIWVTVLHHKIQQGPIPVRPTDHSNGEAVADIVGNLVGPGSGFVQAPE